ncbi:MAG: hypothetical protein JWL64_2563, partial [Frankiales bacterium]|nr:hypothetical protein [Frankiales bacterium]
MNAPAVDLSLDEDREDLAQTLRAFLRSRSDEAAVRAHAATELGWDRDVWQALAGQVGVAGLAVPEEYGGAGCGFREVAVVLEEAGR